MTPLPDDVAAELGRATLPTGPALAVALRGLSTASRLALWAWAHVEATAAAGGPPTLAQWAAVLSARVGTLASLRTRHEALRALEVTRLACGAKRTATPSEGALRSRASRERAKAAPAPKRRAKRRRKHAAQ